MIKNVLTITCMLLTATFMQLKAQTNPAKPNVIFIMADDLNDYIAAFGGHPQAITPNIDNLAKTGIQFSNAQSNVPVCQPSRNSIFTGVYPHNSEDYGWTNMRKQKILKNNKTLMMLFKENGYKTLGSGKLTHGKPDLKRDWDIWGMNHKHNYGPNYFNGEKNAANPSVPFPYANIGPIDGSFGRLSAATSEGKKGEKGWVYGWSMQPFRYINDDDRDLLQDELHAQWAVKKIKELEKQENQKPFFMGIGFVRPHTPLHAPDKYFDMFPLESLELSDWIADDHIDTFWEENFSANKKGPKYYRMLLESYGGDREVAIKHFLQAYLACVAFLDDQVGTVINALDNSKFKDNTIVVFTSDHGWQMGEKNYLFKNSPWEESAKVPLVIRTPDRAKGAEVKQPVSLIDIFPTLVAYCNLEGENKLNNQGGDLGGYSLVPFLNNPKTKNWEGPNGALTLVGNAGTKIPTTQQSFSYRTIDYRYILYGNGKEELYDHKKDAFEWKNVASEKKYKKIKKQLKKEMLEIIENK